MRTALAVLEAAIELEAHVGQDDDEIRSIQRRHVRRLGWLIDQYLDFAAIETGRRLPVAVGPVDLRPLLEGAAEVFADNSNIDLDISPQLPHVHADRDRARQIIMELLNNAVRFSPRNATITVRAGTHSDRAVAVTVTDQGPGVHTADRHRLFTKSYRTATSTGSGIGLYVARILAEMQQGTIHLDSSTGQGASFTLLLPLDHGHH